MEYLSFGRWLERCRFAHLAGLCRSRPAPQRGLVLGDGDGRFLARLLAGIPRLQADAVDLSPAMLRLLRKRVRDAGAEDRLATMCGDARGLIPPDSGYDLVVSHFFLDCLTEPETAALIEKVGSHLAPGAIWLVSEFEVPSSRLRAGCARALIASLYLGFRLLTGLRVRRIPPWRELLERSGFVPQSSRSLLGGLLVSELWRFEATTSCPGALPPEDACSQPSDRYSRDRSWS